MINILAKKHSYLAITIFLGSALINVSFAAKTHHHEKQECDSALRAKTTQKIIQIFKSHSVAGLLAYQSDPNDFTNWVCDKVRTDAATAAHEVLHKISTDHYALLPIRESDKPEIRRLPRLPSEVYRSDSDHPHYSFYPPNRLVKVYPKLLDVKQDP